MKKPRTDDTKGPDLNSFDSKMIAMAKKGDFDNAINETLDRLFNEIESAPLSQSELIKFQNTVQNASVKRLILESRKTMPVKSIPFGRFLQLVRDRCEISKIDIARTLGKEPTFIEKIENGQTNPLDLIAEDVVDIMQLFRMTLTELKNSIAASLSVSDSKKIKISAIARSTLKSGDKGQEDKLGLAMDAALQAIIAKRGKSFNSEMVINPDYIETIKRILKNREESALLE